MYKEGDIIKVRDNLIVNKHYGECLFVAPMLPMLGKEVKITKSIIINSQSVSEYRRYRISGNDYYWSAEMFESVKPKLFKLLWIFIRKMIK